MIIRKHTQRIPEKNKILNVWTSKDMINGEPQDIVIWSDIELSDLVARNGLIETARRKDKSYKWINDKPPMLYADDSFIEFSYENTGA